MDVGGFFFDGLGTSTGSQDPQIPLAKTSSIQDGPRQGSAMIYVPWGALGEIVNQPDLGIDVNR